MRELLAIMLTVLLIAVAALAYTLCFTVTTLGGYLPAGFLVTAPLIFYGAGYSTALTRSL